MSALDEAIAYVAADSPDAAERLLIRILDVAKSLDRLTERGRMVPELKAAQSRSSSSPPSGHAAPTGIRARPPAANLTRPAMEAPRWRGYLHGMDTESRAAITALGDTILARMDHYFELQQAQFVEWRAELRGEMYGMRAELRAEIADLRERVDALAKRVDSLTERVTGLEHEVAQLRDFVTREIAEIRLQLREMRGRTGETDELRHEIAELAVRVDRLERRQQD